MKTSLIIQPDGVRGYTRREADEYLKRHKRYRDRWQERVLSFSDSGWIRMRKVAPCRWETMLAVSFGSSGQMVNGSGSPYDTNWAVTAGTNLASFAMCAYDKAAGITITGITYNGSAFSSCGPAAENTSNEAYAQPWYLLNPTTGSSLVLAISTSGTMSDMYVQLKTFANVGNSGGNPVRSGSYTTTTISLSLAIPTQVGDATTTVINGGAAGIGSVSGSPNSSVFSSTTDRDNGGSYGAGSDYALITSGTTQTHTWSSPTTYAIAGFSIMASGGATGKGFYQRVSRNYSGGPQVS